MTLDERDDLARVLLANHPELTNADGTVNRSELAGIVLLGCVRSILDAATPPAPVVRRSA